MKTYKLLKIRNGKLYPLYVEMKRELPMHTMLEAGIGELVDENHVKSRLGALALRPGFHSTIVPFTDWIGKRVDGRLVQRRDTVWCECRVYGQKEIVGRHGKKELPCDWYEFKTRPNQPFPWIISNNLWIERILSPTEVSDICRAFHVEPQPLE